jgi:hypothetical protein
MPCRVPYGAIPPAALRERRHRGLARRRRKVTEKPRPTEETAGAFNLEALGCIAMGGLRTSCRLEGFWPSDCDGRHKNAGSSAWALRQM